MNKETFLILFFTLALFLSPLSVKTNVRLNTLNQSSTGDKFVTLNSHQGDVLSIRLLQAEALTVGTCGYKNPSNYFTNTLLTMYE